MEEGEQEEGGEGEGGGRRRRGNSMDMIGSTVNITIAITTISFDAAKSRLPMSMEASVVSSLTSLLTRAESPSASTHRRMATAAASIFSAW